MRFKLGTFFDIDVYVHWSNLLLPVYFIANFYFSYQVSWQLASLIAFIVISISMFVLLHEFGHALAARVFGIKTHDIILSVIGGVARLESRLDRPKEEFVVAIAGPMMNLGVAGLIAAVMWLLGYDLLNPDTSSISFMVGLSLVHANLFLFVFNLIPAFPMDGGRILRSLLSFMMHRYTATVVAVRLGQMLAACIGVYGFYANDHLLMVICAFVFLSAQKDISAEAAYWDFGATDEEGERLDSEDGSPQG